MTNNGKLLAAIALAPIVADFLEDCEFRGVNKMRVNALINQIRGLDSQIMTGATIEVIEQQIKIQREFRQWIENNFSEEI